MLISEIRFAEKEWQSDKYPNCYLQKGAVQFLVSLCRHSLEKCPLKSLFTRCMRCLSPSSLAESPEAARIMFEKIRKKVVEYHTVNAGHTDASIQQDNKFLLIVKNNREEFLIFDKVKQRLDEFYWKYMGGGSSQLNKLYDIFKILLMSRGQAQVGRGFSANSQILFDNLHSESLIAQRVVNDHMEVHELAPYELKITKKLIDDVKQSRSRYFSNRK